MGYAIYQMNGRDCGYGVPAVCEQPGCDKEIDRGMGYCCGGAPDSEISCAQYFCGEHLIFVEYTNDNGERDYSPQVCDNCALNLKIGSEGDNWKMHAAPYPQKPDTEEWCHWKLVNESWAEWRKNNPKEVEQIKKVVAAAGEHEHDWPDED